MKRALLTVVFSLTLPLSAHADVLISEIAWMGTDTDANNEWIELYNFSDTPADLTGFAIEGAVTIALSGILPPHGVGVLERTDDDSAQGVTALLVYTGALSNDGGTITLKDESGAVVDEIIGGEGWSNIGGTNIVPKQTPQRTRTGAWVTALPTPGEENAEDDASPTTETNTPPPASKSTAGSGKSGGSGSSRQTTAKETIPSAPPELSLSIEGPRTAYVNQEVFFEAAPRGLGKTSLNSLKYFWNFGDMDTGEGKEASHVFAFPGEYVVALEAKFAKHEEVARHEITVRPISFSISKTVEGDFQIRNHASYEVDLGGFTLRGDGAFTIPKLTFLKGNGTVTIPKERFGGSTATLFDTQGALVASFNTTKRGGFTRADTPSKPEVLPPALPVPAPALPVSENSVIRIGDTPTAESAGVVERFFATFIRFFGR